MGLFGESRPDVAALKAKRNIKGLLKALRYCSDKKLDPDYGLRADAARALGSLRDRQAVEPLIDALLADTRDEVRAAAAEALGEMPDERAVRPLMLTLCKPNRGLSGLQCDASAAYTALSKVRTVAGPPLVMLLDDADPDLAMRAAMKLGEFQVSQAVDALLARLGDAQSPPAVRRAAASALGQFQSERVGDALLAAYQSEATPLELRSAIAVASFGLDSHREQMAALLISALHDDKARLEARQEATDILGGCATDLPGVLEALFTTASNRETPLVLRLAAVKALVAIREPDDLRRERVGDMLVDSLADEAPEMRLLAGEGLAQFGKLAKVRSARLLAPLIGHQKPDVQLAAIEALGAIGGQEAVDALVSVLIGPATDLRVRQAAAQTLGHIGDTRVVPSLAKAFDEALDRVSSTNTLWELDELFGKCDAIVTALAEIGLPALETQLVSLDDLISSNRLGARLVQKIGEPAVEPLIAAFRDRDRAGCARIARWLGQIGRPAVEPLIAALNNPETGVCRGAAIALGQIDDQRAIEPLKTATEHTDWMVCEAAAMALINLGAGETGQRAIQGIKPSGAPGGSKPDIEKGALMVEDLIRKLSAPTDGYGGRPGRAAVEMLGKIGDARAVVPLCQYNAEGARARARAYRENEAAHRVAGTGVYIPDDDERAARALMEIGWPSTKHFIGVLSAPHATEEDLRLAVWVLEGTADRRARKALCRFVEQARETHGSDLDQSAKKALGRMGCWADAR